jgi:hypothetical protein
VAGWVASALGRRLPYSAAKYRSRAYLRTVRSLLRSRRYDLAVVDHAQIGWIQPELDRAGLPFVLSSHNIEERLYADQATEAEGVRRWILRREARLMGGYEERLAHGGRGVWSHAEADAEHFQRLGRVWKVPVHSGFTEPPQDVRKQYDIALMGTWTHDNTRAALAWFLERVHPRLPEDLSVEVAGRGGDWIDGGYRGVRYRGFVPDALEYLAAARVVAVPGVGGTGVQIKTLDAIASGAQVVASPAAVRDLASLPSSVHVAHTPEDFAGELSRLASAAGSRSPSQDGIEWTRRRREQFQEVVASAAAAAVSKS